MKMMFLALSGLVLLSLKAVHPAGLDVPPGCFVKDVNMGDYIRPVVFCPAKSEP